MSKALRKLAIALIFICFIIFLTAYPVPFNVIHQVGMRTSSAERQGRNLILNFTVSSEQFISWGNQTTYCNKTNVWPLEMSSSIEKYCQNIPLSQGQKYSFTFYDYFDYTCPSSLYFMTKTDTVPQRILEIYISSTVEKEAKESTQIESDKMLERIQGPHLNSE